MVVLLRLVVTLVCAGCSDTLQAAVDMQQARRCTATPLRRLAVMR